MGYKDLSRTRKARVRRIVQTMDAPIFENWTFIPRGTTCAVCHRRIDRAPSVVYLTTSVAVLFTCVECYQIIL